MPNLKNIGYPLSFTQFGLFNPTTDIQQNAKNKLLNLLYTMKGERVISNNCEFGINLTKLLFQNFGYQDFESKMAQQIDAEIKKWIPEIDYTKTTLQKQQHSLRITIEFAVNRNVDQIYLELNLNE